MILVIRHYNKQDFLEVRAAQNISPVNTENVENLHSLCVSAAALMSESGLTVCDTHSTISVSYTATTAGALYVVHYAALYLLFEWIRQVGQPLNGSANKKNKRYCIQYCITKH